MAGRIEGEHVLVTGGARGIGASIAAKALDEGALVSIIDLDEAAGRELLAALGAGKRASFTAGDVRRASDIAGALEAATKMFGPVKGLVNNAGRNVYADPVAMTEEEWEDVFAVDLKSAWLAARAVLPAMKAAKKGAIVNIASLHADMTYPGMFPYAAAKSGLVGLTRSLAPRWANGRFGSTRCRRATSRRRWSPSSSPATTPPYGKRCSPPIQCGGSAIRRKSPIAPSSYCRTNPRSSPAPTGAWTAAWAPASPAEPRLRSHTLKLANAAGVAGRTIAATREARLARVAAAR
jgi:NADP-dependent 3-hydroxy acid dehydrogenase YdfG